VYLLLVHPQLRFRYRLQRALLLIDAILNFKHSVFLQLTHATGELQVQGVLLFVQLTAAQLQLQRVLLLIHGANQLQGFC
jgi:hypothetical protein